MPTVHTNKSYVVYVNSQLNNRVGCIVTYVYSNSFMAHSRGNNYFPHSLLLMSFRSIKSYFLLAVANKLLDRLLGVKSFQDTKKALDHGRFFSTHMPVSLSANY